MLIYKYLEKIQIKTLCYRSYFFTCRCVDEVSLFCTTFHPLWIAQRGRQIGMYPWIFAQSPWCANCNEKCTADASKKKWGIRRKITIIFVPILFRQLTPPPITNLYISSTCEQSLFLIKEVEIALYHRCNMLENLSSKISPGRFVEYLSDRETPKSDTCRLCINCERR